MDDHFWPSVYPGIIVGLIVGLSGRSIVATLLGACGGLMGAFLAFFVINYFGVDQGILPVVAIIAGAIVFAKFCLTAGLKIIRRSS